MEVSGKLEAPAGLTLGKESPVPMNGRLGGGGGGQSQSGSYGDEILSCPCWELNGDCCLVKPLA